MRPILSLLLAFFVLSACRPPDADGSEGSASGAVTTASGLQARLELSPEPSLGTSPVSVFLLQDGAGVSGADIEITGDMTHAGMVPVIVNASESEPGLYIAEDFEFTMAGDWIISADIDLPGGESETVELDVTVPGN